MEILERRLQNTMVRIEKVNDSELNGLAQKIGKINRLTDVRLGQLRLLRWLVRLSLIGALGWVGYVIWCYAPASSGLKIELHTWNEAASMGADFAELVILLIPILCGLFLIERLIDRAALLSILSMLELINDQVYDRQFDDNPYQTSATNPTQPQSDASMFEFLDSCTALLLLIRMIAQKIAQDVSDRVILDRCGIIRRGAGDNHSRILMKIGILKKA